MANVFFSYSHKDIDIRDEIDKHFSVLKRSELIQVWHDREIEAGNEFDTEIKKELEFADIILLLVSSDFLNSQYCQDIEMKRALERHKNKEAKVVPIIVDICDWRHTELRKLKSLPNDGRPIKKYYNRKEAYQDITNEIRRIANRIHHPKYELAKQLFFAVTTKNEKTRNKKSKIVKWLFAFSKKNIKLIAIILLFGYLLMLIISDKDNSSNVGINKEPIDTPVISKSEEDNIPPWDRLPAENNQISYKATFRTTKNHDRAAIKYSDGTTSSISYGHRFTVIPEVIKQRISIIDNQGRIGSVSHEFVKIEEPESSFNNYSIITQPEAWLRSSPIGDGNIYSNRIRLLDIGEQVKIHQTINPYSKWQLVLTADNIQGFVFKELIKSND